MKEDVNKVIDEYIKMVEKIANGKTNILDFGDDMVFYRGEVHMIKMIGDFPGIFISEMARNFNVTRAVVSKTIKKLETKHIVFKEIDEKDKKRIRLYLTQRGKEVYLAHQKYHNQYDSQIFDYLDELDHVKLKVIEEFLQKANQLIENHF